MNNNQELQDSKIPRVKSATRNIPNQISQFQKNIVGNNTNNEEGVHSNRQMSISKMVSEWIQDTNNKDKAFMINTTYS